MTAGYTVPSPSSRTSYALPAYDRGMEQHISSRMERAWTLARDRFSGYELIRPGDPTFICQAQDCPVQCCKVFSVTLTEREVERLSSFSGKQARDFLECEDGEPIYLPLADPYVLKRSDGGCSLLGEHHLCTEYEGRPDACRLYPHHVVFVLEETGKPVSGNLDILRFAVRGHSETIVPLLLRHLECPGFTGPPIALHDWEELFIETYRLQYHDREPFEALQPAPATG